MSSNRKRWKRAEREIADLLPDGGGVRVPVTGRGRGDAPDIRHPWLSVEVKNKETLPLWLHGAMHQAKASATDGQLPIAVLHEVGTPYARSLVVVELGTFTEWFGSEAESSDA